MKIKSAENININNILLLVAMYIGLDGLGLGLNMGGYSIMGVSIAHVLVLFIVFLSFTFRNHKVFNMKNDLTLPIILLFGLFLIEFFISTISVTFIESQYPMGQLIKNVLGLYIYFLFFPIILLISNINSILFLYYYTLGGYIVFIPKSDFKGWFFKNFNGLNLLLLKEFCIMAGGFVVLYLQ